ncbi:MAG TPA: hemerythrin domain-containing protein [Sphingomicrobium sp.]
MATRTRNSSSNRSRSNTRADDHSAFAWDNAGVVVGAAIGGAALALAANFGRKLLAQSFIATDDWAESLTAEHEQVLATFDKMLATDESQTIQRSLLLGKLAHMLDRHAYSEEHVIYPALREANEKSDAETLETEHGEVKEFLFRLKGMEANDPTWIDTVREFRESVAAHAQMEEDEVFPRLKSEIGEALDSKLTKELAKASFMMA